MIAVDANLLVYAHVSTFRRHEGARAWLEEQLALPTRVGLPWSSLLAFVRLVTNPRVFSDPEPISGAWSQVEAWLDADPVWIPAPLDRHREVLGDCLSVSALRANDVPDAHLAAIAVENGLRLATTDSGFARFERLEWFNPLQS